MNSILCFDPSSRLFPALSVVIGETGAVAVHCHDAGQAISHLDGAQAFTLMIVLHDAADPQAALHLLKEIRLRTTCAAMLIAYVVEERDLQLAHDALQSGATEVVMRSDDALIRQFILQAAKAGESPMLSGRVLLVEDEICQAEYLQEVCQLQGLTVDHCGSMEEGVIRLGQADYQIAIIDILLSGLNNGLALVRHIRQLPPPHSLMSILVVSGFDDAARRVEALRIGADDFLAKPFAEAEFFWRLQKMRQARSAPVPQLLPVVSDLAFCQQHGLSTRECQVCEAMIRGLYDKQIAQDLNISFWTVRTHIAKIFTKLGVMNRRELMARYLPHLDLLG